MSSYLQNRRGNYHVRVRVPSDLSQVLPYREIVKSLKTKDKKTARRSAYPYLQGITSTFSLLRSGFITDTQAQQNINDLLNRKTTKAPRQATPQKATLFLSKISAQYVKDKQGEWVLKTKLKADGVFKLIIDLIGDMDIHAIDRQKVRELRDMLTKLPANCYKLYPDSKPLGVLKRIDSGELVATPLSVSSVNIHIGWFNSLMVYCVKEGHIASNPAAGLSIRQKRKAEDARKAYSVDDLQKITDNLPPADDQPERYYVPLISMYSGLRLNEACQLYTDDVKEVDGIWCFDVNDSQDKTLKTISSERLVPVHPRLIDIGFIDHVKKMKKESVPRLWMNLNWREADGHSNGVGKWFQRFNRQHVTDDLLKTFHSLRHTFADTLKQLGVQEVMISELMGHANDSITTGRYGKRYQPGKLLEVVRRIDY